MRRLISSTIFALGLTVCLGGGCTMTAHIDYDQSANLSSYRTYAWAPSAAPSLKNTSQLMHRRVIDAITKKLDQGLQRVDNDPDLLVTYHTNTRQEVQIDSTTSGYSYGPAWHRDPYWTRGGAMTSTRITTYTVGTLIVDIWDTHSKLLVWRGTVEDVVTDNPEKKSAQIYKAIDKLAKEWAKMKAKTET